MSFLKQMAAASAERAGRVRPHYRDDELDAPLLPLARGSFDVIAELKDRSPSAGGIARSGADRLAQAECYARGGAAAVSVLTEPSRFGGSLSHLAEVAARLAPLGVPAMRKDFLVAPRQVTEARAAGASGVLLIVAMQDDAALDELLAAARDLGMFVLLESFDRDDLKRTAKLLERPQVVDEVRAGRLLAGINTRDLRTLEVDPARLERLSAELPAGVPWVAESGLASAADAAHAAGLGYRLALVGTALMQSGDPQELLREMLSAARARCAA